MHSNKCGKKGKIRRGKRLITEDGNFIRADFIGKVAGTIADMDQIRKGIGWVLLAGQAGEEGIGKSTTEIAGYGTIGEQDFNFTAQTVPSTELWDRVDLKNLDGPVPAVFQKNIDTVLAAQIPISVGERKADFDGVQGNTCPAALFDRILADSFVFDERFDRKFRDTGTGGCQDCAPQGQQDHGFLLCKHGFKFWAPQVFYGQWRVWKNVGPEQFLGYRKKIEKMPAPGWQQTLQYNEKIRDFD